ncbi:nucleoside hydrolase [Paenibacillus rhizoplanae]
MLEIIRASEEKITLVPTAPLTNIALLITAYPEVKERIEKISLMGGGLAYGNVTRTAEFNIYVDPEAARIVFLNPAFRLS